MKHSLCAILTAVFLSALCIPCAAADTTVERQREYPGFADVAEGSVSYDAIRLCYEAGLMNGKTDDSFDPQGKLTIAQLVVLAARLYDLQNGGDGTVPELPDLSQSYLRIYNEENGLLFSWGPAEYFPEFNAEGVDGLYLKLSDTEEDLSLPETCRMEAGFEDCGRIRNYEGVRESYTPYPGAMNHGYSGTGYRFTDPDAASFRYLPSSELAEKLKSAWWFPAAFYLASEGRMNIEGELLYRASGGNHDDSYDPLARFDSDHATRALFAWLVDLSAGELPVLNETVSVPDVDPYETQDAEAILRLYQAGVLTGTDKAGNFNGGGELTRAQAAIMLARVLDPAMRVKAA